MSPKSKPKYRLLISKLYSHLHHYILIIPGKLTNLQTSSDTEKPKTHCNAILTSFLATMFQTPYKQMKNMNDSSFLIFCFHLKIPTFTFSLYSY